MKNDTYAKLTRKLNLVRFFEAYERMNSESDVDPSELAEREHELQVTDAEWDEWRESKEKAEAQF